MKKRWGNFKVLAQGKVGKIAWKVKLLEMLPGLGTSTQFHKDRCEIIIPIYERQAGYNSYLKIDKETWHRLANNSTVKEKFLEFQFGTRCSERDIKRR